MSETQSDTKKKKPMSASDYIKTQPSMQGSISKQNKYSVLADFPPLSYSKAVVPSQANQPLNPKPESQKSDYIQKAQAQHLMTTHFTKPILLKELQSYTSRLFYEDSQWVTDNDAKDRMFYEFILVDTKSVEIIHYPDLNNPNVIKYSTCKILRICSIQDLGLIHHHVIRPFSSPGFHIQGFTYMDYHKALFNTFYLRPRDHSWFFSFDRTCPKLFPGWFYEWWHWFGPTEQIYPPFITKTALPYYTKHMPQHTESFTQITFHIDMGVPWITSWHFNLSPVFAKAPLSLTREFRIKWWEKYNQDRCSLVNQEKWFQSTKFLNNPNPVVLRPASTAQQHGLQHPNPPPTQGSPTTSTTSSTSSKKKQSGKDKLKQLLQQLMDSSDEDEAITQPPQETDPQDGPFDGPFGSPFDD